MANGAGYPSPTIARIMGLRLWLLGAAGGLLLLGAWLALTWAPTLAEGFTAPVAQRIFYFHFGAAIASYAGFTVTFVASLMFLKGRKPFFDTLARDAAGVSLIFAAMMLTSGPIWGSAEWGVPWRWEDSRLVTYLVLSLVFVGYFALRRSIDDPTQRARTAATYALVGYVLVPMSYLSLYLWQSLHPRVISPGGQGVGAPGGIVMIIEVFGSLLLFAALLLWRLEVSLLEEKVLNAQRMVSA